MNNFFKTFHLSWDTFLGYVPAILGAIICFTATLFIAGFLSKITSKYALKRSKDSLIANFIGKIVWSVVFILGTVLALGILGWELFPIRSWQAPDLRPLSSALP